MQEIHTNLGTSHAHQAQREVVNRNAGGGAKQEAARESALIDRRDSVELSNVETTAIREDVVAQLRDEIARGEYLTPTRVDGAVDRLLRTL